MGYVKQIRRHTNGRILIIVVNYQELNDENI